MSDTKNPDTTTLGNVKESLDDLNLEEAFVEVPAEGRRCICCDGRIDTSDSRDSGAARLPGAGIFEEDGALLAQRLRNAGVTSCESHQKCGAAKAVYMNTHPDAEPTQDEIDEFASGLTELFCDEHGFEYDGQRELDGPHTEQAVIIDATPAEGRHYDAPSAGRPTDMVLTGALSSDLVGDAIALVGIVENATSNTPAILVIVEDEVAGIEILQQLNAARAENGQNELDVIVRTFNK